LYSAALIKEKVVNYYGPKQLAESFRTVRKNTLTIAQDIPGEHYGFRAMPETRSVAELLTHIGVSPNFTLQVHGEERRSTLAGFDFPAYLQRRAAEEKKYRSKDQILELLSAGGEKFSAWVEGLPENFLSEVVQMPEGATPPSRTRFDMILSVKEHEMHHRGQLMLIERMLGIVPHLTRRMQERLSAAVQK
jgi:uncharacterized damage-inducible protein DinB